ncbi:MAG: DUF1801 domain-containing protein [Lewinella sp.]
MINYPDVDAFLANANQWQAEMALLRQILLDTDLTETIKWGKPTYTYADGNIAIIQPFKESVALMFFKGILLNDPQEMLEPPGPNAHAARRIGFSNVEEIRDREFALRTWITEAKAIEKSGTEVPEPTASKTEYVSELSDLLATDQEFRTAFESLTPGRRRAYNLHFSSAKQSQTRVARIAKCTPRILAGKGLRDR